MPSADAFVFAMAILLNTLGVVLYLVLLSKRIDLLEREVVILSEALHTMADVLEFLTRDENWAKAREEVRDVER